MVGPSVVVRSRTMLSCGLTLVKRLFSLPVVTQQGTAFASGFGLDEDRREILEQVDRFARNELHGLQQRMDDEEWWPEKTFPLFGEHGYLGVTVPPELGGAGLDFFASGLVVQAVARWNPAIALSILAHKNLCLNNILANASAELCARYL